MGCGICVVRCGRGVLRFDYEKNVAVVAYPPELLSWMYEVSKPVFSMCDQLLASIISTQAD